MRNRNKSYADYGFDEGEEKRLKKYCTDANFCDHELLLESAISANPTIAIDLFYSLTRGIGYDKLSNAKYIPMPKTDFYGYQRKCLSIFKNFLVFNGKWR